MRARQISNLDWISNRDIERWLRRLLHAHARLRVAPYTTRSRSIYRRWHSRASRAFQVVVIVNVVKIGNPSRRLLLLERRHRCSDHHLLLERRHRRGIQCGGILDWSSAQRAEGIVNGFELGRLGDDAARSARGSRR